MSDRSYDIVLFGATGYTGELTAEYLANAKAANGESFRWALAGRNEKKLADLKSRLDDSEIGIVQADVGDSESLAEMARSARVLITTVGPYIQYGLPVVQACAANGCHYVDLTGEPEFTDTLIHEFHALAEKSGAKIVNGCGFDSIPYDLGVLFAVNALKAPLSEAQRGALEIEAEGLFRATGTASGGTWHSLIGAFSRVGEYKRKKRAWRAAATPEKIEPKTKVSSGKAQLAYRNDLGAWAVPLPTNDPKLVKRSAALRGDYGRSFRYSHYMLVKKRRTLAMMAAGVGTMFALTQLGPTRKLLLKAKSPGEGPTAEQRAKGWFKVYLRVRAEGRSINALVSGGDPGYGETAKMLAESALCLALDGEKLPPHTGIVPPAAAMGEPLIERLIKAGIEFKIESSTG